MISEDKSALKRRKGSDKAPTQGLAANLQAKKQKLAAQEIKNHEEHAALSQADTREDEEDKETFFNLIRLLIHCHESENKELLQQEFKSRQKKKDPK